MSFLNKMSHFLCIVILYVCCVEYSSSFEIVDDYKLNLSSSGPALYGSFMKFDAKLFEGTSLTPQDEKLFKYDWKSDVDQITETQHADFNTSLHRCFDSFVIPRNYTMTVTVHDLKHSLFNPIVKKSLNFSITDSLNGNLHHEQTIHRRKGVHKNIFSTQKPISFLVNITDMFEAQPSFTYKWYYDGKIIDADNYNNRTISIIKPGVHTVMVNTTSSGLLTDCKGSLYGSDLKGSFHAKLVLKDPVLEMTLFGQKTVDLGQNVSLQAVFNGSAPYTVCWELLSLNDVVVVNQSCVNVTDAPMSYIFITSGSLSESGSFTLNVSIENDVSIYLSRHVIVVKSAPPSTTMSPDEHSPAHILIPVICALLAITLMLFAGVYFVNVRRARQQHIESANFDFHTSIRKTPRGSILSDMKDTVRGFLKDTSVSKYQYGAMEHPAATA